MKIIYGAHGFETNFLKYYFWVN